MATENDQSTPAVAEPAAADVTTSPADGDDASTARPRRSRRATSGGGAARTEKVTSDEGPGEGPAEEAAAPAPPTKAEKSTKEKSTKAKATKAKATKAKSTKAKSTKAKKPAEASTSDQSAAADGDVAPAKAEKAASTPKKSASKGKKKAVAAEASAEPGTGSDDTGSQDAGAEAPAGAAFGLLFQAPEPTVVPRRSRRPAGKPAAEDASQDADATPEPPEARAGEAGDDADGADGGDEAEGGSRRRRRGGRGRRGRGGRDGDEQAAAEDADDAKDTKNAKDKGRGKDGSTGSGDGGAEEPGDGGPTDAGEDSESTSSRRRRRRRRSGSGGDGDDPPGTVTKVREPRADRDEPTAVKGSTRLEAKKQRRREGREAGRRRTVITEAEFLARRESVERVMVVRGREGRTQIGVLEDGVLVEHYVSRETTASMAGNVYLGRVQNVLPSMEAAFVDIGKGRNAVLYAGEVNWDAAGLEVNQSKRIENALSSGDTVLVQVTKDPIGHKGARLTSQISLPGRYLVYVPEGQMTGISRKLPDTERARLKGILKAIVPDSAGVIVRTAAEGASEEELRADVERLTKQWERIRSKADAAASKKSGSGGAPVLLHGEPDLTIRVIRDVFTEDFTSLVVSGDTAWSEVSEYVEDVAPDLASRLSRWTAEEDVFAAHRIDEQLAKAMDRKVWLPSGGSLVIDRTEAMTVVDVNTGKFVGSGGNLEETVTKNNLEAAEEIVRQLRLRDIGGIIVIDFIDMVLESNRDLVVRRLLECLGRDRTKHQVAEVTSLGLVQMTRKRVGSGLIEVFSEPCEHCGGRGILVHTEPVERGGSGGSGGNGGSSRSGRGRRGGSGSGGSGSGGRGSGGGAADTDEARTPSGPTAAQIAAAAHAAALRHTEPEAAAEVAAEVARAAGDEVPTADAAADVPEVGATEPAAEEAAEQPAVEEPAEQPAAEEPAEQPAVEEPAEQSAAEPEQSAAEPEQPAPEPEPAPVRPRRRRGRVVAPAGPPPGTEPVVVDASAAESGPADAPATDSEPTSDG